MPTASKVNDLRPIDRAFEGMQISIVNSRLTSHIFPTTVDQLLLDPIANVFEDRC